AQSQHPDDGEPDEHHRPEHGPDAGGPATLHQEQTDQDHERHGDDPRGQRRRRDLEPLDGAEHRDRRRQCAVRVQERRPKDAEDDHEASRRQPPRQAAAVDECHQGEHAPFALVVRPDDHDVVLDRHHDHQGPEHERQYAEHVARCDGYAVGPGERITNRVQGARADVAVDHAERGERERQVIPTAPVRGDVHGWRHRPETSRVGAAGDGARMSPASARVQMAVMITADPTHQRQIAWSTNSSIAVRYSVNPNPIVASSASRTVTRRSAANLGCTPARPIRNRMAYPTTPMKATGTPNTSAYGLVWTYSQLPVPHLSSPSTPILYSQR